MSLKPCFLLVFSVVLPACSIGADSDPAKEYQKEAANPTETEFGEAQLQGTWKVVDASDGGKKRKDAIGVEYTFADGALLIRRPGRKEPQRHKYEIDAKQNPPHLDALLTIFETSGG